jgi:hypothetical protein
MKLRLRRINMSEGNDTHLASGILAGIVGGLVASWVMNEFMENLGPKLQEAVEGAEGNTPGNGTKESGEAPEDATMKTADAVVSTVTGGRYLTCEQKEAGGPVGIMRSEPSWAGCTALWPRSSLKRLQDLAQRLVRRSLLGRTYSPYRRSTYRNHPKELLSHPSQRPLQHISSTG